ncbi:MAG TPA: sigma-70 family RNA polymerase sigma factor [Gemmataceae bacterium]|jgi:RNA polymerase sigma factor (sigma-70 family)
MSRSAMQTGIRRLRERLAAQRGPEESDEQLLQNFQNRRDEAAFAALVRRHGSMVLHVCHRVLEHRQDAEDAFQATFLVLARNAASLRNKTALASFLHGIAYRTAMKAKQSAARRRKHENQTPHRSPADPSRELLWREVRALLDEEIARLPESYRSVFVLCCLENLSQAEAGQRLGMQERTVSNRLTAARQRLQERLARRGVELTALLAGAALATQPASALPPVSLARLTSAALSPAVAALAENGLRLGKAKLAAMILMAAGVLAGAGVWLSAKPQAAATPPPAPRKEAPASAAPKEEMKDAVEFSGRVLDPDDKPVAGAKVYYYFITRQEARLPVRATTDAQGRFAFTLTPKDVPLSADAERSDPRKSGHVVVKADGFTFAWHGIAKQQTDLTFHVAPDDNPVVGRIINLEGKPLAGLRVTAWSAAAPEKGDLTPFVKAMQSREAFYQAYYQHLPNRLHSPFYWRPPVPLLPTTTTDADGRFRLPGFAKERVVELRIEGKTVETQNLFVLTRPAPREGGTLLSAPRIKDPIFGPDKAVMMVVENDFVHPLPPGGTVAGTVRDADTGRPIPRAIVESYMLAGTILAQNTIYHTVADDQGRYRFTGLPRGAGNRIRIRPPADLPYVPAVKEVPAAKLFAEATVDAALKPGVWVDVTVADKTTGRPVLGSVSYFVLPEKPSPERPFEQPFADAYNNFMTIRNDGTFRFAAVPRRAILAYRADWEKYPIAREAATIYFPFGLSSSNFQAFAEINPKLGEGPVKVKFVLDAERVVKGKLLDPEGRPLSGVLAAGLRHDWYRDAHGPLKTAEFTALGVDPDRPRLLCFVHPDKKLAGSVVVRGDEKTPIAVKLQPWATVSGRLLDADGKPIPNATLAFTEVPVSKPGKPRSLDTGLHVVTRFAGQPSLDPRTDAQGRFQVERLVPGLKYNLALTDARGATRIEQIKWPGLVFRKLILKVGETKELGDVMLQPFPK